MASASSHAFAAGDIDYINNLNLVRTDVSGLVTEANAKGTMSTQNAGSVAITGGTATLANLSAGSATTGGLFKGGSYILNLPTVATTWVKLLTVASVSETEIVGQFTTQTEEETFKITIHTKYYAASTPSGITVERSGYASNLREVRVTGTDGGDKSIYVLLTTSGVACTLNWNIRSCKGYVATENSVSTPSGLYTTLVVPPFTQVAVTSLNTSFSETVLVATGTTNGTDKLQVNGTASATSPAGGANNTQLATTAWVVGKGYITSGGAIQSTSPTSGVGYATGAGGSVTQTTSLSTGVTLNAVCGKIITFNGNIAANSYETFTFTNSAIGDDDVVVVTLTNLSTAIGNVTVSYYGGVGSRYIILRNHTASAVSGSCTIKFAVIKAVAA